jgi:hypothetical protein
MLYVFVYLFLFATLYSKPLLLVIASLFIVYMVWFSRPNKTAASVKTFLDTDDELIQTLKNLKISLVKYPFDYEDIEELVHEFLQEYMLCFDDVNVNRVNFNRVVDLRREILNHASLLSFQKSVPLPTFSSLSANLWKYVSILIKKWDIEYSYPIPSNSYSSSKELY